MKAVAIKKALGNFKSVENMESSRGNTVPNQFVIYFENGRVFQSYNSLIVIKFGFIKDTHKLNYKTVLGRHWDYSRTTGKYRNEFLGEFTAETRKNLSDNTYIYCEDLV